MSARVERGRCSEPGPGSAHCTEYPLHDWSCYDATEDVSFNHRHDFRHDCEDPACPTPHFTNVGD